jgi:hypothetical protein
MQHSSAWDPDSFSAAESFSAFRGTQRFIIMFKESTMESLLSQLNPVHALISNFSKTRFNIYVSICIQVGRSKQAIWYPSTFFLIVLPIYTV